MLIFDVFDTPKAMARGESSDDALTFLEERLLARGERAYDTGGRPVDMWTAT